MFKLFVRLIAVPDIVMKTEPSHQDIQTIRVTVYDLRIHHTGPGRCHFLCFPYFNAGVSFLKTLKPIFSGSFGTQLIFLIQGSNPPQKLPPRNTNLLTSSFNQGSANFVFNIRGDNFFPAWCSWMLVLFPDSIMQSTLQRIPPRHVLMKVCHSSQTPLP